MVITKQSVVFLALCLAVLLVVLAEAGSSSMEGGDTCPAGKVKKCCKNMSKRGIITDLIQNLIACVNDLYKNLLNGNIKFPSSCCKLPIFSSICGRMIQL